MDPVYIVRFLRGTVSFCASGGFSERFLNLCNLRGIRLISPQKNGGCLCAAVGVSDYRRLRPIARAAGMVLRAQKKTGLPFLLQAHRKRLGLPAAALCFALLAWVLSGFIWSVDVEGGKTVSREQVLSVMAESGLCPGVWRKSLDTEALSLAGMHALTGKVSWLGINLSGSRAVVEGHDYIPPDEDETFKDPCNLVADFDGLLLSVQAENGKAVALPGSGVKEGDLLISGVTEDRFGTAHFYEARGRVTALHERSMIVSLPNAQSVRRYRAVKRRFCLRLFSVSIPLGFFPRGGDYDSFQSDSFCTLGGVALPLGITIHTRAYYGAEEAIDSFPILCDDLTAKAHETFGNTRLLSADYALEKDGKTRSLTQTSQCIDFMGKPQKIQAQTAP